DRQGGGDGYQFARQFSNRPVSLLDLLQAGNGSGNQDIVLAKVYSPPYVVKTRVLAGVVFEVL
ncbi:MAG: hypothetical protein ACJ8F7_07110, partial [Gemmataceae bacterium]